MNYQFYGPDPLLGVRVCAQGLMNTSAHGFDGNQFAELPSSNKWLLLLLLAVSLHLLGRFGWKRSEQWRTAISGFARLAFAGGAVLLLLILGKGFGQSEALTWVQSLPIESTLLPQRPQHVEPGAASASEKKIGDFVVRLGCTSIGCVAVPDRPSLWGQPHCQVALVDETLAPLVLRRDTKHDLWFFEGRLRGQTIETHNRVPQLAFRNSDLRCVQPTDVDLPDVIRPPVFRLAISIAGLTLALRMLSGRTASSRQLAWGASLSLGAMVPILPWVLSILR